MSAASFPRRLASNAPRRVLEVDSDPRTPPRTPRRRASAADDVALTPPDVEETEKLRWKLQVEMDEMAKEKEDYEQKIRDIKAQAAGWKRRREELRQQIQALPPEPQRKEKRKSEELSEGVAQAVANAFRVLETARSESSNSSPESKTARKETSAPQVTSSASRSAPVEERVKFQGSYMPPKEVQQLVGEEPCAICLDALKLKAKTICLCGHIFHMACLIAAGRGEPGSCCPKCRQPIDRLPAERVEALSALVLSVSHALPCEFANVKEVDLSDLLDQVNAAAQNSGAKTATTGELREVLEEMQSQSKVLVHGNLVTFT
eukprot:TRINITY_DN52484_c0_g1_i1.p1 TRINITY_DN52484_c0_g1~~TRINITY_DN52484_c0_g1_i1.p1  ORF type:complete len:336 (+),score=82.10 TRINITY_DN52484_c0_g1_i1:54-1010(+)